MFSSYPLDSLYIKKSRSDEELSYYNNLIKGLIQTYEDELGFLTNPKITPTFGRQQYELILAKRDYMLEWLTMGLEQCSVASLRRYESDLLKFYTKKCHFSKSSSEYLLQCYMTKREFDTLYINNETMPRIGEAFYTSIETMEQFGGLFVSQPLLEPSHAYGNFHKRTFVKHMLIYHFLNRGCSSTGIAEVLRQFNVDNEADDAQVRYIKCKKNKQYEDYLAHIKADFIKIPHYSPESSPKALEKIELYIDSGQFRFRENKA